MFFFVTTLWLGCLLKDKSNNQNNTIWEVLEIQAYDLSAYCYFLHTSTDYAKRDGHKVTKQE